MQFAESEFSATWVLQFLCSFSYIIIVIVLKEPFKIGTIFHGNN